MFRALKYAANFHGAIKSFFLKVERLSTSRRAENNLESENVKSPDIFEFVNFS